MGGSGKTTLDRHLYNDEEVKKHFDLQVWVCVSTEFLLIKVTKTILYEIGSKTDDFDSLNKLQLQLKEQLSNKKFLLVLDDVWNLNPRWERLRTPLLAAAEGSKIVVTSRNKSVAEAMKAAPTHDLGKLSSEDSCYHHLSLPLKHCFAYCSIFPQDHQFNKEKLILLWMAEGSCFVMHDLIHELAQHVSGDFCARVEDDDKLPKVSEKAHHFLYFKSDYDRFVAFKNFEAMTKAKSLRTFLGVKPLENNPWYDLSKRVLQDILPKMWCLRVLSLCAYTITDLPKSIGNLKHLRYLDLSFTMIKKLPESVCCLCNLQTMMLRGCLKLDELPSKMGKLINLHYLDIDGCGSLREMSSHGIGRLKSLQRLTRFIVGQKDGLRIGELGELSEIRGKLYISNMENVVSVNDASRANMKDKSYLDELIFDWGDECTNGVTQSGATTHDILNKLQPHPNLKQLSITNYPGEGFPNWLGDPSVLNLVSLELRGCGNCSTLPPLGQLTQLKYLQISRMNGVECVGDEFYGNASFQFLETLSFEDMQNWEKWLCCGEFPRLQKLFIRKCPKLTGKLPEQLLSLVELQIHECPQLLMASLKVPAIRQLQMPGCDFTALQTSEIEILDASQWSQLPMAPHQLSIRKCDYVESLLEEEISQTNIHDLKIYDCSFSRSLHKVGLPTTLKSLLISKCSKLEILVPELFRCHLPVLESLEIKDGVIDDSLSLSFSLGIFPKLTNFRIHGLKGLEKLSILVSEGDPTSLCSLSLGDCSDLESIELRALNLESCSIYRCSKLRSLAHAHSSVQELYLGSCPELLFQREGLPSNLRKLGIDNCNQLTPQVEWGLQRLTSLTHFKIKVGCEDIELFPKECLLPSSLTSLQIVELSNLKSLDSRGLQQLTSLLQLKIRDCPELQFSTGSVLQHLISLKRLEIDGCSRLQSLTEVGLQHLTSLESLWIGNCPMLQSLTKVGLQHLTSLKTLGIYNCRKLKYLTKERLPDSLSYLHIDRCPSLEKRCQFEKGEEWQSVIRMSIESTVHLHIQLPRCGDLFRRKPINEKVDIWHREKIEATDWELQQRKSVSPGPDSNLWQAFSEAGAQTTIASLLGPEMAITTNQPQKELLALKLGVLEQRVLQPPLLPALIFPDPPLEAIMPSCLLIQRILRASWLLNLLDGLVPNLFGEVISSLALLVTRDENR
ncbi:unnamed protein product, partial [Vitis vinifera]